MKIVIRYSFIYKTWMPREYILSIALSFFIKDLLVVFMTCYFVFLSFLWLLGNKN